MKIYSFFGRNREYLIKIGIEMFSVIFAVILALFINDRRAKKDNIQLARTAVQNIRTECDTNRLNLSTMVQTHDSLIHLLDSVIILIENNEPNVQLSLKYFSIEQLSDAAWEATKTTSAINYIDFNLIMDISKLYDILDIYNKLMNEFIDNQFLNPKNVSEDDRINNLYLFDASLKRFSDFSHQYIEACEELIKEIDEKYK